MTQKNGESARKGEKTSASPGSGNNKVHEPGYVDLVWLKERMRVLGHTTRSLAKALGYDSHTSIQKIRKGTGRIQYKDVVRFAAALSVAPYEMLAQCGYLNLADPLSTEEGEHLTTTYGRGFISGGPGEGPAVVPLIGWADNQFVVHGEAIGLTGEGGVTWPGKGKKRAIRFQCAGGPFGAFDGAVALYEEIGPEAIGRPPLGVLCVVESALGKMVRVIGRGASASQYQLYGMCGGLMESNVAVVAANPVLLIRFPGTED